MSRWFCASPYQVVDDDQGEVRPDPARVVHAKEMGTALTACGENAATWIKFWELEFDQGLTERCETCCQVVRFLARSAVTGPVRAKQSQS